MSIEKLREKFIAFVKGLSDDHLIGMCEARRNISFEGGEFYTFPRGHKDEREGIAVYDSDGQGDLPIAPNTLRGQLIAEADFLLQAVCSHGY